jgi:hypothetical protein
VHQSRDRDVVAVRKDGVPLKDLVVDFAFFPGISRVRISAKDSKYTLTI